MAENKEAEWDFEILRISYGIDKLPEHGMIITEQYTKANGGACRRLSVKYIPGRKEGMTMMRIGISKNFRIQEVYGNVVSASVDENICYFQLADDSTLLVEYPDTERASDALEKILKKEYLVVPLEYKIPSPT